MRNTYRTMGKSMNTYAIRAVSSMRILRRKTMPNAICQKVSKPVMSRTAIFNWKRRIAMDLLSRKFPVRIVENTMSAASNRLSVGALSAVNWKNMGAPPRRHRRLMAAMDGAATNLKSHWESAFRRNEFPKEKTGQMTVRLMIHFVWTLRVFIARINMMLP